MITICGLQNDGLDVGTLMIMLLFSACAC